MQFDNFVYPLGLQSIVGVNQFPNPFPQRASLHLQVSNQYFQSRHQLVRIGSAEELFKWMTGQFRLMRMARPAERDYVHWEEAALSLRRPYITLISGGVESAIGTAPIDLRVARKL